MNHAQFWGGGGAASYAIEQSLRVNRADGASMTRTFNDGGSSHTQWTFSFWTKRHINSSGDEVIFYTHKGSGYSRLDIGSGGGIGVSLLQWAGSSWDYGIFTKPRLRDPSAWYHIVFVYDSPNATSTERLRIYMNGERQEINTTFNESYPSQNFASELGKDVQHWLFRGVNYGTSYYNGYAAETYFIDNQALDPTDFGEFDDNGVWRPIEYTGTYGGNSFYLQYASSGIGNDSSGEGNNWTPSAGFTTSGTGTDVMSDTPTNNYCTLDPINVNNSTSALAPSNGNLDLTAHFGRFGTIAVTSGKWYWEVTLTGTNSEYNYYFGAQNVQTGTVEARMMCNGGNTPDGNNISGNSNGTRTQPTGSRPSLPATIGVKLDMDNGDIEFVQGGVVNGKVTGITNWNGAVAPYISANTTTFNYKTATLNFGQRAFSNTIPTGYSALSTANLPAPTIKDGSDYFQTVLWTGDNTDDRSITVADNSGNSWQPDWVWYKRRNLNASSLLFDAVRGATKALSSNNPNAENTEPNALQAFESTGFQVGSDSNSNSSSYNYVAWNWKAGNGTSSIATGSVDGTNPTIASTVSANPTAGFSVVSYSGSKTSAGSDTVGHGLGVAPSLIIVKRRNDTYGWSVAHASLGFGSSNILALDSTANAGAYSWDDFGATPTSSVFTVSYSNRTNISGGTHIAYCFAEIEGYSKFGSYTGNGSTDGPFVYCGFKPAWIMYKCSTLGDSNKNWIIMDTTREPDNPHGQFLWANEGYAEYDYGNYIDFLSNGFKLKTSDANHNGSGETWIYIAFASSPFGGSGVSPATAR